MSYLTNTSNSSFQKHSASLIIYLAYLAISLKKLSPSIFIGDNGELVTAVASLGISHPPGFPGFSFFYKLFSIIPIGSFAWRCNLITALCGALVLLLLYLFLRSQKLSNLNAALLVLFVGSFQVFLGINAAAEVYSAQLVILALCLLILQTSSSPLLLLLIMLLCGLGCGVHVTTIFLLPVIAVVAYYKGELNLKNLLLAITFFLIGTAVFLYLPLRASEPAVFNWGNPSKWGKFWAHISNKKDAGLLTNWQISIIITNIKAFFSYANDVFTPGGLLLLLAGAALSIKRNSARLLLLVIFLVPFFILYLPLARLPRAHLYAPVFIGLTVLLIPLFSKQFKFPFVKSIQAIALLTLLTINFIKFYPLTNERNNFAVYDHANNYLKAAASTSYLATVGDVTLYGLLYLKTIEGRRPDVRLGPNVPNVYQIYGVNPADADPKTLLTKIKKYPIQFTWVNYEKSYFELPLISNGLLYALGNELPLADLTNFSFRGYNHIDPKKDFWYKYMFINHLQLKAAYYNQLGNYQKAISLLVKALTIGYDRGANLDLGENYLRAGQLDKAEKIISGILKRRPDIQRAKKLLSEIRNE